MSRLLDEWFGERLITFDKDEFFIIDINQDELRGLKQEVFFRELELNIEVEGKE
jgi:hypothetical protein